MSRSKRAPYWVEGYGSKSKPKAKRAANKKVRQTLKSIDEVDKIPPGEFRKVFDSWSITDYKFHDPKSKKVRRK